MDDIAACSHLLDTIGMPEVEYSAFLRYEEMKDKYDYMQRRKPKRRTYNPFTCPVRASARALTARTRRKPSESLWSKLPSCSIEPSLLNSEWGAPPAATKAILPL